MGKYKGADARYNVVSARVRDCGLQRLTQFADERKLSVSAAVDMLLMVGLEYLAGDDHASA